MADDMNSRLLAFLNRPELTEKDLSDLVRDFDPDNAEMMAKALLANRNAAGGFQVVEELLSTTGIDADRIKQLANMVEDGHRKLSGDAIVRMGLQVDLPSRAFDALTKLNEWQAKATANKPGQKNAGEVNAQIRRYRLELEGYNVPTLLVDYLWQINFVELHRRQEKIALRGPDDELVAEGGAGCCKYESFDKVAATDKYTDTAAKSVKEIEFRFKVKKGEDPKKCVMVNWVKGFAKAGDGTFFQATHLGKLKDINFKDWTVDSVDTDPVYWSDATARWNYLDKGNDTYAATDGPGPALSTEKGAEYRLQFKMCLYCIDDVPKTVTKGFVMSKALKCVSWDYSVKVSKAGKFTHPKIA